MLLKILTLQLHFILGITKSFKRSKTGNFVGDKEGFLNAAAEYMIKSGDYTFIILTS